MTIKVFKKNKASSNDTTDLSLLVSSLSEGMLSDWDKKKVIESLEEEAGLDMKEARAIATEVETRIFATEIKNISTGTIRSIIDDVLFEKGLNGKLRKQQVLGIPTYDLEQYIFSKTSENSNISANNPEAVSLAISEAAFKQYALSRVFSKEVAEAHLTGKVHLHDLGYITRVYCSSHSLEYIKKYGLELENLNSASKPASHARTLTGHLNTFLASMQAYYAGALGIGYVNIFYAPLVRGLSFERMKQEAQHLIFSASQNAFSRGGQTLFLDFNIHTGIPSYLKNIKAIGPGGKYLKETYGDFEKEAQMFAKAMLEVWREGDCYGRVFSFPKCDFHISAETFTDKEQYKLFAFACEIASENGSPYFVFDRDEVTLAACCRLRTVIDDNYMIEHPESMRFCGFQNVSINLPQAAYRAEGNYDKTVKEVMRTMDIAMKAHLQKKRFIGWLMEEGLPLWQIGMKAKDGRPYVDLEAATYIIGIIGLNECIQRITGKQLHEDEESYKLGLKLVSSMYLKAKELGKENKLKVTLEESPAESAAYRLAKVDLHAFKEAKDYVRGSLDSGVVYYTNSVHYAANAEISIIDRIVGQARFNPLIESGAITHIFLGEQKPHPKGIENIIKKVWDNTQCAQLVISPEFTFCNDCKKTSRGWNRDS